jgi:hypothetical protein
MYLCLAWNYPANILLAQLGLEINPLSINSKELAPRLPAGTGGKEQCWRKLITLKHKWEPPSSCLFGCRLRVLWILSLLENGCPISLWEGFGVVEHPWLLSSALSVFRENTFDLFLLKVNQITSVNNGTTSLFPELVITEVILALEGPQVTQISIHLDQWVTEFGFFLKPTDGEIMANFSHYFAVIIKMLYYLRSWNDMVFFTIYMWD